MPSFSCVPLICGPKKVSAFQRKQFERPSSCNCGSFVTIGAVWIPAGRWARHQGNIRRFRESLSE
jgi:hypothetical protein